MERASIKNCILSALLLVQLSKALIVIFLEVEKRKVLNNSKHCMKLHIYRNIHSYCLHACMANYIHFVCVLDPDSDLLVDLERELESKY
jgi:hypothetical protein